ncbi:MAG TPA: hypothetical protein VL737_02115 [Candidatus Pristimantibacillus sp.]|nr:hypothetical protein [Candidatus Pristimantibacillus sp.]
MSDIKVKSPLPAIVAALRKVRPYVGVLIFLLLAGLYGYMIFKVNSLASPTISDDEVLSDVKSLPVPRIDDQAAKQLQTLKDNSVNVQTLFDQNRTNPFQE